ncbi:unnamed protein product [Cunninghamella blakesleeana]
MPQQIQPYPQQESMDHLSSKSDTSLEVSPITVPSMSPITDFPLYYGGYYLHYYQTMPRPLMPTPIHSTLENATISYDTLMENQAKWHKDLLVKDVFLSPPMLNHHHHHHQQNKKNHPHPHPLLQNKKIEMAPSDLLFIGDNNNDVFGLNDDNTCILLDYQKHHSYQQQQQQRVMINDLPTPPATSNLMDDDYLLLGMKRRHSSISSSDNSSDDGSSVQSDAEKRPCLVHSPCSLPESPSHLPMFDFDDEDEDENDNHQRTLTSTDFQPYPTILESMTDDEEDMTLHETIPLKMKTNQNPLNVPTKPKKSTTVKKYNKKQLKEKTNNKSSSSNNTTTTMTALKTTKLTKKQQLDQENTNQSDPNNMNNNNNNNNGLPTYVPHGSPEVDIRYSTQGLYKHLLKQRVDWCRYCGTTEGVNWRPGPWGKRTLCNKHGCDYKGYGFACKLPRLDLTAFMKEPMDQRIRPVLQLFCTVCHRNESWEDNLLVQCDGCPMAYHQQCRREADLTDDFCQSNQPFFCTDHVCKENLEKKRVVVEFSRKRLPLMRTPKQQQQQQQNLINL